MYLELIDNVLSYIDTVIYQNISKNIKRYMAIGPLAKGPYPKGPFPKDLTPKDLQNQRTFGTKDLSPKGPFPKDLQNQRTFAQMTFCPSATNQFEIKTAQNVQFSVDQLVRGSLVKKSLRVKNTAQKT